MREKRERKRFPTTIFLLCLVLGIAFSFFAARYYVDNRMPGFSSKYVLKVYPDADMDAVIDSLVKGAGAKVPASVRRVFEKENVAARFKPGCYVITPDKPAVYAARMLVFGWQTPVIMTLSGTIRTKEHIAGLIGKQMMVDSIQVINALNDNELLSQYGFSAEDVFGLILPDSYEMYWTSSIKEIFDRLDKEYERFWTAERLGKAASIKLSQKQVSVMASIVNGESLKESEYARIAGVYMNRYNMGMKLQADPTICYIYGYKLERVLLKHLETDSPYNTYMYAGLPPTPINVPLKACIDAVLNYEHHNYLYFCANSSFDGTHKFASSYTDHLKNARDFQTALNAKK